MLHFPLRLRRPDPTRQGHGHCCVDAKRTSRSRIDRRGGDQREGEGERDGRRSRQHGRTEATMPPPPSLSSLRLGLGAQQLFSARTTGARRIAPPSVSRACLLQRASPFSTSQPRPGQGGIRRALEQNSPRVAAQQSPKLEMAARMNNLSELATDSISVILPGAST